MLRSDSVTHDPVPSSAAERALARPARLDALRRTRLLDSEPEEAFDRATRLASRLLNAPISLVLLVTPERQSFKAQVGVGEPWASERGTPLSHSFCQYVVATRGPLIVNDATLDPLVQENAAVSDLGVRAYLGVPFRETNGEVLGAFCAIDTDPRDWSDQDLETLEDIAATLGTEIALHLRIAALSHCEAKLHERHHETLRLSRELRHRAKNLLAVVTAIMNLSSRLDANVPGALNGLAERVAALSRAHIACMDDDPHDAELAILLQSLVGGDGRVRIEPGPRVQLPNASVTSLRLILYEWMAALGNTASASLRWEVEEAALRIGWSARGTLPRPSSLSAIVVDAAVQQLNATLERHETRRAVGFTLAIPRPAPWRNQLDRRSVKASVRKKSMYLGTRTRHTFGGVLDGCTF